MNQYLDILKNAYKGYLDYFLYEINHLKLENYFYGLIVFSILVFVLEILFPWRKNQKMIRKDFWLDLFYMFFNFFIFNIIIFAALSNVTAQLFHDFVGIFGINFTSLQIFNASNLPFGLSLLAFFIVSDFTQWNTHRLLHRVPFLWQFHKVHHSVQEMGFAAHLRYHWMENVVYKTILYIPISLIGGWQVQDVFIVHYFAILVGHLNHANINWDYGILKYILNNPKMHIWHHAQNVPHKHGNNFALTLSIWDYIFKTNYIPYDGKDEKLGFTDVENFPNNFVAQELYPFFNKKSKD
jgi:sterol desaturase/sphingolipid hydroxylase (fatty acid hydroxylase superfamily)